LKIKNYQNPPILNKLHNASMGYGALDCFCNSPVFILAQFIEERPTKIQLL